MFKLSNLKKFTKDGWCYLSCDFSEEGDVSRTPVFEEKTMWIAVEEENADMLADNVYDPFVLVPVAMGMYFKQDVHIDGNISPRLYHHMRHYVMNILDRYSNYTSPIRFTVNGFDTVEQVGGLIGTGISCGVDSLTTIYDNFIDETDPNFRINSLFFFNCGSHGMFEEDISHKRFRDRAALNRPAAGELGLPMYLVESNFHAFTDKIGYQKIGVLGIPSCVLGLQRHIKRYYISNSYSYDESARFSETERDNDIMGYAESFLFHLFSTENCEFVIDGCQYERPKKTERISDWPIAQKYLNVCCLIKADDAHNCSRCRKCARTLLTLEGMGKLEQFKEVFDLDVWHKNEFRWKCWFLADNGKTAPLEIQSAKYAMAHGVTFPPRWVAVIVRFVRHWLHKFGVLK